MSKPPRAPRKKRVEFPDPDQHTCKTDLRKAIRKTLIDLREHVHGSGRERLIRFSNVLSAGGFHDPGRLPYGRTTGRSPTKRAEDCLMAMIAKMISDYWWVELGESDDIESVQKQHEMIRKLADQGIGKCSVEGDDVKGYTLT